MMTAFRTACCLSPLVLISGVWLIGKNKIDDCADKLIAKGKAKTTTVGCDEDAADKSLLVSCDISDNMSRDLVEDVASPFMTNDKNGDKFLGLQIVTEMYQCVRWRTESKDKQTSITTRKSGTRSMLHVDCTKRLAWPLMVSMLQKCRFTLHAY